MNKIAIIGKWAVLLVCAIIVYRCSDDEGVTNAAGNNDTQNQAADSLTAVCQGGCAIDSGTSSYTKDGNSVTMQTVSDSGDTVSVKMNFKEVNDSQAVVALDSSIIPPELGTSELVLERVTGSGNTFENDVWRLDSIKISNDSLGVNFNVAVPGSSYLVLDSASGEVVSAADTSGTGDATQEILVSAVASCPLLFLQGTSGSELGAFAPVDSIDLSRSSCDTTWGYKSGKEVYVVSDGVDKLYVYDAATRQQQGFPYDLNLIMGLMQTLMAGQTGFPGL